MMMMAISIVHGSIDLNAQCAEGDYRARENGQKKSWKDIEKFWCTLSPADTDTSLLLPGAEKMC